jgi:hypothetical protein
MARDCMWTSRRQCWRIGVEACGWVQSQASIAFSLRQQKKEIKYAEKNNTK